MFGYLILLFTLLPALELALLIKIGGDIGVGNTLLIIIFTGVFGAYLARLQGFLVLQKIQNSMNQGQMPSSELLDGLMILIGGIVLLTPGFVTDTLGFFLLIPWTRSLIKVWVGHKFESMIQKGQGINITSFGGSRDHKKYDDIDI
ncbi:hypothetical protein MNBD_UNCLBAC01-1813 [hydrothermal vent metagenome]|uniref:FxsA protein n=1 Tax=hydrothermal vent metagenome TaxID=652676 RepID=A0A3B1DE86_9ZZZZ